MTTLTTSLLTAGAALGVSAAATPAIAALGRHWGVVDRPDARKVHSRPIPRVGGLAIGLATLGAFAVWFAVAAEHSSAAFDLRYRYLTLMGCSLLVLIVGLLDDLMNISAKWKMLVLVAAAVTLCASGATIDASVSHTGYLPALVGNLKFLVTIAWLVAIPVAINFIDGLDGLAGGITLMAAGVMAIGLATGGDPTTATLLLCLAGGLIGFLIYNTHPARVFMGDSGSMFIGFLIAGASVVSGPKGGLKLSYVLPVVTLSVPLLDTTLTFIRRGVLQRRSIFSAERGHIHHKLLDMGLSHRQAVWCLYGVTAAAACVGIIAVFNTGASVLGALVLLLPLLFAVFRISGSVRGTETIAAARRNLAMRRQNKAVWSAFEDAQLRFRDVRNFDRWWELLCESAEKLKLATLELPLTNRDGSTRKLTWAAASMESGEVEGVERFTARIPIRQRRDKQPMLAEVSAVICDGSIELASYRVALFSRLVNEFNPTRFDQRQRRPAQAAAPEIAEDLLAAANTPPGQPRVAIVHDFLYVYAGAEKVLEQMLHVYPHADLFSLFDFLPAGERAFIRDKPVKTSFLQRLPGARTRHRAFLPLMPLAIEQFDLAGYDIVLSSSYCVAKGVLTRPDQLHICYCHSPIRFAWDMQHEYLREMKLDGSTGKRRAFKGLLARSLLHYIRMWDIRSSTGVDEFLSNSDFVGRRITKSYRRDSKTLYPPVDTNAFTPGTTPREDFYVTASRMVPYKRLDLIVEAFTRTPHRRLVVIGDGPDYDKIAAKAGPNVRLVGRASHEQLVRYLRMAKGFVFAAEEDFGIVPVEAMACGTPVIAYRSGGVCETVIDGKTGVFFDRQDADSLNAAIDRFEAAGEWDSKLIRAHATSYSTAVFRERLAKMVGAAWARMNQRTPAQQSSDWDRAKMFDQLAGDRPRVTEPTPE